MGRVAPPWHPNDSVHPVNSCVVRKYLNDELKILCLLQFFPEVAQNSLRIPWVFHAQRNPWVFQVFQVCGHPVAAAAAAATTRVLTSTTYHYHWSEICTGTGWQKSHGICRISVGMGITAVGILRGWLTLAGIPQGWNLLLREIGRVCLENVQPYSF